MLYQVKDTASTISREPPPSESALSIASTATTTTSPNPSKIKDYTAPKPNKNPLKRIELLERHSIDQARLLTQISNSIKRNLRDVKHYEAKRLKLEEECK
ncbi:hypothetical protein DOY81_003172 [Sarcophaga bullata]|nr:hypothetical protein DOY81_003172 [Sarcophaga bullata]